MQQERTPGRYRDELDKLKTQIGKEHTLFKAPAGSLVVSEPRKMETVERVDAPEPRQARVIESRPKTDAETTEKEKNAYFELIKRVSCADYPYEDLPFFPLHSFFGLLSRQPTTTKKVGGPPTPKLVLPIPDTIVFEDESRYWLATNAADGVVMKSAPPRPTAPPLMKTWV
ncbi:hypothetical protein PAPYR_8233 [Paratrimastix pyriformis]|uniref:Uncharacterized protein n=1 Tax=Paratrimastix pyriformis TaxID=342808 RepID=A0ABQ8UEF8_9EUKA|nr:hypothetical protein PAPYR_8233 [Paratrimastix pyriformis]